MFVVITLLTVASIQSCHKISGEGPVVSKTYPLSGFTGVESKIDADVYFIQDSFYKVEIQAQANIQDIMDIRVENGTLLLQFDKYKNVRRYDHVAVYVTAPNLTSLGINGSGNIRIQQPISVNGDVTLSVNGSGDINANSVTASSLYAKINGSGSLTVNNGTVNYESAQISGSGNINLVGVMAKRAKVETSGSGKTTIWATDDLDVRISGSGDVFYKGSPSMRVETSGSGKVSHL